MTSKPRRAEPLSPEERRHSIITAVIPLLIERGAAVTTKQMAEAAGIAEGTIFGVFPDKRALIFEAVRFSMDPAPIKRALSEIYPEAPIDVQMAEAARILLEYQEGIIALISILRTMHPKTGRGRPRGTPDFVIAANKAINESMTELFERHRDRLSIEPELAASAFRGLIFASGHSAFAGQVRMSVHEIVAVLARGILEPVPDLAS